MQQLGQQQRPVPEDGHHAQGHVVRAGDDVRAVEDDGPDGGGVVGQDGREVEAAEVVAALVQVDAAVAGAQGHQGLPGGDAGQLAGVEVLGESEKG